MRGLGQRLPVTQALGAAFLAALIGCSSTDSFEPDGGGDDTTEDNPGMIDADLPPLPSDPERLPFSVDDFYYASGHMGDGETGNVVAAECVSAPGGGGFGKCHQFTWTPAALDWAGVFWQFPDGNWGTGSDLGHVVPPGATKVTFRAWGEAGGETVNFVTGMMAPDGFNKELKGASLTTTPQAFTIELGGTQYNRVIGAFGWTMESMESAAISFYVDDIRWE